MATMISSWVKQAKRAVPDGECNLRQLRGSIESLNDENRYVYRIRIRRAYGLWTSQLRVIGQILLARMSRVKNGRRGIGMYSNQSIERPRAADDQHSLRKWDEMMRSRFVLFQREREGGGWTMEGFMDLVRSPPNIVLKGRSRRLGNDFFVDLIIYEVEI